MSSIRQARLRKLAKGFRFSLLGAAANDQKGSKMANEISAADKKGLESNSLGRLLQKARSDKKLSLRAVEEATGGDVSNAYLSQLETGKIAKPSPHILYSLSEVYGIAYETLMQRAGYIVPSSTKRDGGKHGSAATFAINNLSSDEEKQLLDYLKYLRSKGD